MQNDTVYIINNIVGMVQDEENFNQATRLFCQVCEQQQDYTAFITQFVQIFCDKNINTDVALQHLNRIENGLKFLNQLPDDFRGDVNKVLCRILLTVIRKERPQNSNKLDFFAQAIAFAVVTKIGILQLDAVIGSLQKMITNPAQRNAGLVTLAKLVEMCHEDILNSENQEMIKNILLSVGGGAREFYNMREVDWICVCLDFKLQEPRYQKWKQNPETVGHEPGSQVVQLSYDYTNNILFSAGYDGKVIYWENNVRRIKKTITLQNQQAVSLNWCQDTMSLLGCTRCRNQATKNVIFAYDSEGQQKFRHETESVALYVVRPLLTLNKMAVSETLANNRPVVKIYDMERVGQAAPNNLPPPDKIIYHHQQRISDVQVDSSLPQVLLTTSFDGEAYLWDIRQPEHTPVTKLGAKATHTSYINSGDICTQHGQTPNIQVITAGHDFKVKIWDARNAHMPQSQHELDDSAVLKVGFDKLSGIVSRGTQCAASTMDSLYQINLETNQVQCLSRDIPQDQKVATRDFVWVGSENRRYLYTCQNDGVVAIYKSQQYDQFL